MLILRIKFLCQKYFWLPVGYQFGAILLHLPTKKDPSEEGFDTTNYKGTKSLVVPYDLVLVFVTDLFELVNSISVYHVVHYRI